MSAPYIQRRRAGYYVRVRHPADLRPFLGSHLVRSLHTPDKETARSRALGIVVGLQGAWAELRAGIFGQLDAVKTGASSPDDLFDYLQKHPSEIGGLPEKAQAAISAWLRVKLDNVYDDVHNLGQQRDRLRELASLLSAARASGIEEGLARAIRINAEAGNYLSSAVAAPPPSAPQLEGRSDPWPDLISEFMADRPDFAKKTVVGYATTFRHFEEAIGVKAVREITKQDVKKFADFLRDKPSIRSKTGTLKRNTILRQLTEAKVFLRWAVACGYVDDRGFEDIKVRGATQAEKRQLPEEIRRAFTPDETQRFFDTPLFTGYKSARQRSMPGTCRVKISDYWFFVIIAHTGARIAEIASAPAALRYLDDIPCLDLIDAGSKTPNARRLVPIIPCLRHIGFLEYAAGQAQAGRGLMDPPSGPVITPDAWSKRLNRYIDDVGFDDDALVAYSFRHSFRQMLRAANLNHEVVNKCFGHESGEVGEGYGKQLSAGEARLIVERVKLPIHLDHLTVSRPR